MKALSLADGGKGDEPSADAAADEAGSRTSDSIFSQLLERIVQGGGIKVGNSADALISMEILLENCPDAVLLLTPGGEITDANPAFCGVYGYTRQELVGQPIFQLIPPAYQKSFIDKLDQFRSGDLTRQGGADDIIAFRGLKADGSSDSMDCLLSSFDDGERRGVIAIIRDLSFDREVLDQLRATEDHYVALSETITEAIFRVDEDFRILFANSGAKSTFGYEREDLIGRSLMRLFPEEVFRRHEMDFRKYFVIDDLDRSNLGLKRTIELIGVTKNRGVAPMEMSFGNSKEFRGRTLTCIVRDISQRKIMERRLRHLAYHDKLTGLGNRDLFNEDMRELLKEPLEERELRAGLLFVDLDGFKNINDTFGHAAGDQLLIETGRRIRVCLRDTDTAYRFGGDEFVVLLPQIREVGDASYVAERILHSIRELYDLSSPGGERIRIDVGVSIGVAVMPDHGRSAEEAIRCADIAMYCSKESGKNRYTVFDESLNSRSTKSWRLEQEMRSSLVKGEFVLHYQPIVDMDGCILGFEALTRWLRDGKIVMPPGAFIPLAEENGTILPLGAWVFRRAFIDRKRLEAHGFRRMFFSVNVSARQFERRDFVDGLFDAIESARIEPSCLNLELTETILMREPKEAIRKLHAIKKRYPTIRFAIDDFGTGYSSLSYLSTLPVDSLKIDISFVRALHSEQNQKIVNAILNLADSMSIDVVAEGIETAEQRRYFRERGCKGLQGYLFGRALPILELERQLLALRGPLGPRGTGSAACGGSDLGSAALPGALPAAPASL
ncbi:MAG TPA: EAL domain-containing protein [Rectinemataceae bacterium]|nr:EAL domain-containing protein [Rectinemataceae bacterium]